MAWVGVDFDGTLATDKDSLPIPAMVERIKRWISLDIEVRILTARVNLDFIMTREGKDFISAKEEVDAHTAYIAEWCRTYIGKVLPVTCSKDYEMYVLFDDRARQVIKDTGEIVGNVTRWSDKHIGREVIDEETGFIR